MPSPHPIHVDPSIWDEACLVLDARIAPTPEGVRRLRRRSGGATCLYLAPWQQDRLEVALAERLGGVDDPALAARRAGQAVERAATAQRKLIRAVSDHIAPTVAAERDRIYHGGERGRCYSDCPCTSVLGELVLAHVRTMQRRGVDDEARVTAGWVRGFAAERYRDQVDVTTSAEHGTVQKVRRTIFETDMVANAIGAAPTPSREDMRLMRELVHRNVLFRLGEDRDVTTIEARLSQWANQLWIDEERAGRLHADAIGRLDAAARRDRGLQHWIDRHLDIGRAVTTEAVLEGIDAEGSRVGVEEAIALLGGRPTVEVDEDLSVMGRVLARAGAAHRAGAPAPAALLDVVRTDLGDRAAAAVRHSDDWAALVATVRRDQAGHGAVGSTQSRSRTNDHSS
ncbi:MAG TPA: hypothetical protein VGO60_01150 [Iamia sp.]|nr:hypothetical protein [Iamia sp.]